MTTLEKIDEIRNRAHVSFTDAKAALEANGDDVVNAIASLEGVSQPARDNFEPLRNGLMNLRRKEVSLSKNGKKMIALPATISLLLLFFCFPFTIAVILLSMVAGYHLEIND